MKNKQFNINYVQMRNEFQILKYYVFPLSRVISVDARVNLILLRGNVFSRSNLDHGNYVFDDRDLDILFHTVLSVVCEISVLSKTLKIL